MTNNDLSSFGLSETAMLLAAGFGKRLRPLTLMKPKPLLEVGGRSMLDRALDHLSGAGVKRAVVNSYYLADAVAQAVAGRAVPEIILSREERLLDTGGGIKHVLPAFGGKPFFSLNSDLTWEDGGEDGAEPALLRMARFWDSSRMDALLLMMPTRKARGFGILGDYNLEDDGVLSRRFSAPPRSHVWIGAQILKPELFEAEAAEVFSNNKIWNAIEPSRRLYGIEHTGTCYHVGTQEDWALANLLIATGEGWAKGKGGRS